MIAFASAGALNGCHARIPPVPLVQPHTDHQLSPSILHIFIPLGSTLTKLGDILLRNLLHPFQGKLGHSPIKLQTRYKTRQPSKPELLFNEAAHCSASSHLADIISQIIFQISSSDISSDHLSKRQEKCPIFPI